MHFTVWRMFCVYNYLFISTSKAQGESIFEDKEQRRKCRPDPESYRL